MQFKKGATVYTADGEQMGEIDRVVIKPDTKEVTHLVVQKGFLFTEDKVIPVSLARLVTEDQVVLRGEDIDFDQFPDFEESHYVPVDDDPQAVPAPMHPISSVYWYPPMIGDWWTIPAYHAYAKPRFVLRTQKNIPEGTVALEEGAKVIGSDGGHIGNIECILAEPVEGIATHLVISEGLILKEKKLIPTSWLSSVREDRVHLSVESGLVDRLPEYQPQV